MARTTRDDADSYDARRIAAHAGVARGGALEGTAREAGMAGDGVVPDFSLQTTKRVVSHALYPIRVTERDHHGLGDDLELRVAPIDRVRKPVNSDSGDGIDRDAMSRVT